MKLFEVSIKENENQDFEVTFDSRNFRTTKTFDTQKLKSYLDILTEIGDWLNIIFLAYKDSKHSKFIKGGKND